MAQQVPPATTARMSVVHSFGPPVGGPADDARIPYAAPLLASDGWLYGVGSAGPFISSKGAAFRCDREGESYSLLLDFQTTEGRVPQSALIEGTGGQIYGTAPFGNGPGQFGTVFRMEKDGSSYATLHSFTSSPDGANPSAGVIEGPGGFLYGATEKGGTNQSGTLFRISTNGSGHEVLYHFRSSGGDGRRPVQSLMLASDGRLYGTTFAGGAKDAGSLFTIKADGSDYRQLHSFGTVALEGLTPSGPLLELGGSLYGLTSTGGQGNHGTLYRIRRDGSGYEVLHRFEGTPGDGHAPYGRLAQGLDGWLYGTSLQGGGKDVGTLYRIRPDGSDYTVAWSCARVVDQGQLPQSGLVPGPLGELYGTSTGGGEFGFGTVYRFNPPVGIRAELQGGDWVLEWDVNGLDYRVMAAEALDAGPDGWVDLGVAVVVDGPLRRTRFPATSSTRFVRLQWTE